MPGDEAAETGLRIGSNAAGDERLPHASRSPKRGNRKLSRTLERGMLALLVVLLFSFLIGRGLGRQGWEASWRPVHIRTTGGSFGDSRNIPLAAKVQARGGDPYEIVPDSPYPPYNYPRPWLWLFRPAGSNTLYVLIELGMAVCYLACVVSLIYSAPTGIGALLCALGACTPAAMLAVERGNTDLLVFSLCYVGVAVSLDAGSWICLLGATVLKLYPAAALAAWLALRRSRGYVLLSGLCVAAYLVVERHTLAAIRRNTPAPGLYAYGTAPVAKDLSKLFTHLSPIATGASLRLAEWFVEALFLLFAAWALWKGRAYAARTHAAQTWGKELPMFLVFAFVYIATFLAGANYVYRLIFLLPTLPFLAWLLNNRQLKAVSVSALAMTFLSMSSVLRAPAILEALSFLARTVLFVVLAFLVGWASVQVCGEEGSSPTTSEIRSPFANGKNGALLH